MEKENKELFQKALSEMSMPMPLQSIGCKISKKQITQIIRVSKRYHLTSEVCSLIEKFGLKNTK